MTLPSCLNTPVANEGGHIVVAESGIDCARYELLKLISGHSMPRASVPATRTGECPTKRAYNYCGGNKRLGGVVGMVFGWFGAC